MGDELPTSMRMLAIATGLGKEGVLKATEALAEQSHFPKSNLTLINEAANYAHNDPAGGYPNNVFEQHVLQPPDPLARWALSAPARATQRWPAVRSSLGSAGSDLGPSASVISPPA
jgi:hypothetical protein